MANPADRAHPITITVGELRLALQDLLSRPDDARVYFGAGDLTFYRIKDRGPVGGPDLVQFAFGEIYTVTDTGA